MSPEIHRYDVKEAVCTLCGERISPATESAQDRHVRERHPEVSPEVNEALKKTTASRASVQAAESLGFQFGRWLRGAR